MTLSGSAGRNREGPMNQSGGLQSTAGQLPETNATYTVIAFNRSGISIETPELEVAFPAESVAPFTLPLDKAPGYRLAGDGMRLYAAVRGDDLYVATWTPAGGASDHFIFVARELLPAATLPARWVKSGLTAFPSGSPYLGAESTMSYIAWFNAPHGSSARRSSTPGGRMEGVIDLVETFGEVP